MGSEIARVAKRTLNWRCRALVALAFGLLVVADFASGLNELGLPQMQKLAALLLFNLGVEVGQISLAFLALAGGLVLLNPIGHLFCLSDVRSGDRDTALGANRSHGWAARSTASRST